MTKDVVALTKKMPDPLSVIAGLLSGGPDLLVGAEAEGALVRLHDEQGRPLLSVEAPLLVQVRGEAERLLGASEPEVPYWWTEARATTGVKEAEALAGTFVGRIATLVGGTAWPRGVATSIGVVNTEGMTAVPVPAAAQPAVDVLTDKVAVVIQDRPVVAMTSWLADTFRAAAEAGLGLQIVTPAGTRLSPTVRGALPGWPSRWVVQDEKCGYYDGLSGAILQWANGLFVTLESPDATDEDPRTPIAETFAQGAADTGERQLAVSFRCVHPADDRLVLGGAVESVWREITDVAFERSPEPTWVVVVGSPERPGLATVRITRTTAGVEEDVTLAFGYGAAEEPPTEAVQKAAEALATRHDLQSMLVQVRRARRDLSVPPHFEGPGVPYAFVLGAEEVRTMPGDRARRTPLREKPRELGPRTRPALYYPFPGDPSDLSGWQDFERLMRHLKGS
jgi:Ni,Fe-hydrogenase III small subunit